MRARIAAQLDMGTTAREKVSVDRMRCDAMR